MEADGVVNHGPAVIELRLIDNKLPENIELPFKWEAHLCSPYEVSDDIITRLLEKDEEIFSDTDFEWRSFIIQLVICYELYRQNKLIESIAKIKECETILKSKDGCSDVLYKSITNALWHVTLACKAFLMLESGLVTEAQNALKMITPVDYMDISNQAGMYGIKAAFLMEYGFGGNKEAVQYADIAAQKDPAQAEWQFLLGKATATCRRVYTYFDVVEDKEIKAMKEAVRIATLNSVKPLRYLVYLANVYREYSFRIYKNNVENPIYVHSYLAEVVQTQYSKARDIYKTVLKLKSDNPRLTARCCFGLLKLPLFFADMDLIGPSIKKAADASPNNAMILHVVGMFYDRCCQDFENALKYYTLSANVGCYGAWHNMIKIKYCGLVDYSPIEDYNKLLARIPSTPRRHHTLSQIASYYLFQKRDLLTAIDYTMQVFNENPNSYSLKMFKPNFLKCVNPFDLMKVLTQEVQFILHSKINSLDNDQKKKLRLFLIKVGRVDSNLLCEEINLGSSVEKILAISKKITYGNPESLYYINKRNQLMLEGKFAYKKKGKESEEAQKNAEKAKKFQKKRAIEREMRKKKRLELNKKKIKQRDIETGLPIEVVNKIKECNLYKQRFNSGATLRSLSESRKEKANVSGEGFQKKIFKNSSQLNRSASVDCLQSFNKYNERKRHSIVETDSESSVGYGSDCSTLSWRKRRGEDRAFGRTRESSLSSVDSDYENPRRDIVKEFKSKSQEKEIVTKPKDSYLSWRTERGGEDRAFGDTNIMNSNMVKGTNTATNKDSDSVKNWKSGPVDEEKNLKTDQIKGKVSRERQRTYSVGNDETKWSKAETEEKRDSRRNEYQIKIKKELGENNLYIGNPHTYTRVRSYSTSSSPVHSPFDPFSGNKTREENGKRNRMNDTGENKVWKGTDNLSAADKKGYYRKWSQSEENSKRPEQTERKDLSEKRFSGNPNQGTRTRSYSMSANPTQNLFQPVFKTKTGTFNKEKQNEMSNFGTKGSDNPTISDIKSGAKWDNSRWVSENKDEIKEVTSAKAKAQTVIRDPYGPEEGKKGFLFIRQSRK